MVTMVLSFLLVLSFNPRGSGIYMKGPRKAGIQLRFLIYGCSPSGVPRIATLLSLIFNRISNLPRRFKPSGCSTRFLAPSEHNAVLWALYNGFPPCGVPLQYLTYFGHLSRGGSRTALTASLTKCPIKTLCLHLWLPHHRWRRYR